MARFISRRRAQTERALEVRRNGSRNNGGHGSDNQAQQQLLRILQRFVPRMLPACGQGRNALLRRGRCRPRHGALVAFRRAGACDSSTTSTRDRVARRLTISSLSAARSTSRRTTARLLSRAGSGQQPVRRRRPSPIRAATQPPAPGPRRSSQSAPTSSSSPMMVSTAATSGQPTALQRATVLLADVSPTRFVLFTSAWVNRKPTSSGPRRDRPRILGTDGTAEVARPCHRACPGPGRATIITIIP